MDLNINKLFFAIALIAAFTAGALLSYIWVVGYYVSLELKAPKKPAISIYDFTVSVEDPTFFNISILNPSFSPNRVEILGIHVLTGDNIVHKITSTDPKISSEGYTLDIGASETFRCSWNWTKYTGQSITIIVLVKDGSGGALNIKLPLIEIKITSLEFNPEEGSQFNVTIENSNRSDDGIDLVNIKITDDNISYNVETYPSLPIRLNPSNSTTLTCKWNWFDHQNKTITLTVETLQGFIAEKIYKIPLYAILIIENVEFNPSDTSHINVTIVNPEKSLTQLNITDIRLILENGTTIMLMETEPKLPYIIGVNRRVTFTCEWNWSIYRGKEVTITVNTKQGYKTKIICKVPP